VRYCKLDWKPDTGMPPRIFHGTRILYSIDDRVELTSRQRVYFPIVMALLAKDIGIEGTRLDAMIQEGGLGNVLVKAGT
jgi:hypothetical protein